MNRIEPMTVEEIKTFLATYDVMNARGLMYHNWGRLILAWAHERARANKLEFLLHPTCSLESHIFGTREYNLHACPRDRHEDDWLNEVLDEISWPKEHR